MNQSRMAPSGILQTKVTRSNRGWMPGEALTNAQILVASRPHLELPDEVNNWREENAARLVNVVETLGYARDVADQYGLPYMWSQLWLRVKRQDGPFLPYGLAGCRVVTTAGMNAVVDAFQNTVELETFKYHGIGTGSTAEASGDTALVTELTTQYNVDNTRATGTTTEGASANIYKTVGTNTVDASASLREHGIFTVATSGSGTLLDRTVFALISLNNGDSLESTYEITFVAGS